MHPPPIRSALPSALALHLIVAGAGLAAGNPPCTDVARKVQRDVAAKPERVLLIVEDALVVEEACACEVTKAAIVASKASPKLVGQIVFTAVTATPKNAALIAECAAATSPDASGEIKSALAKALGGSPVAATVTAPAAPPTATPSDQAPTADAQGKNPAPDKNPPPPPPPAPTDDFGLSPVTIGGVYLVYPGGGGPLGVVEKERTQTTRRLVRRPRVIVIRPPTATSSTAPPGP